jgi:alkylation response protein AidB-like acyl-CoA dehydrogenase
MRFALTEEQQALGGAVRDLLAKECPPEVVRAAWPSPPVGDRAGQGAGAGARAGVDRLGRLWSELAAMGVPGLLVDEAAGGLGLDEVAAAVVWEQTGYAAVPFGVVEIAGVVAPLLAQAGHGQAQLLASVLAGEERPAVRGAGASVAPWFDGASTHHVVVLDAETAALGEVDHARDVRSVDGARRLAEISSAEPQVLAGADAALAGQRAALGTAAQLVGVAQRMLDMTVAYVIDRRQYGVAIGSFQAVKHHLADVRLQLEFARPAVLGAAWALATRQPPAARDVSMAKALASDCAQLAARKALQCHGAIGHTVEYDLHLFVKRAWALAQAWGDAAYHRDLVARAIGLTASPVT